MNICRQCKLLLREIFIFALIAYVTLMFFNIPAPIIFIIALMPIYLSFGTRTILFEALSVILPLMIFAPFATNIFAFYLPFVTWTLTLLAIRSGKTWAIGISAIFILAWAYGAMNMPSTFIDILLAATSMATLIFYFPALKGKSNKLENINIITMSLTGNTKEMAEVFAEGASKIATGKVDIKDYSIENIADSKNYDGVVIAFPTHLFGINRRFFYDIIKNLPYGDGKPTFILYTASLYADMASLILWIALIIKGYSVKGRLWIALMPLKSKKGSDIEKQERNVISECGGDFADGWFCGMPLTIIPSPLYLLSFIINKKK